MKQEISLEELKSRAHLFAQYYTSNGHNPKLFHAIIRHRGNIMKKPYMPNKAVVLDIETDSFDPQKMKKDRVEALSEIGIKVACINYGEKLMSFTDQEIDKLTDILSEAYVIIGFNLIRFDYPVLTQYMANDSHAEEWTIKTIDIMAEIQRFWGHRYSLKKTAEENLNISKGDYDPECSLEELTKHCQDDVKLTKSLYATKYMTGKLSIKGLSLQDILSRNTFADSPE